MNRPLIMVGPDLHGLGGISMVSRILKESGLFNLHNIVYVSSVADGNTNRLLHLLINLFKFIQHLVRGARAVYAHTSSNRSFYRKSLFILIGKLFGKKILLHIHPTHFFSFVSELKGLKRNIVFFVLEKVDVFITLTEFMQKRMSELFPHKQVYVLRNPVDVNSHSNRNGTKRAKDKISYLGWFIREKGVYELVDAAEMLLTEGRHVELDFYGTKQINHFKNYISKKGLEDNIKVNGWINFEKKLKVLYSSTMIVLPSHSEGIPNVILEAMATKTPIVSTHVGGLKELLVDRKNALITDTNNVDMLKNKIAQLLDNPLLRDRIAEGGFNDAQSLYDVQIIIKRLGVILDKLCL